MNWMLEVREREAYTMKDGFLVSAAEEMAVPSTRPGRNEERVICTRGHKEFLFGHERCEMPVRNQSGVK